MATSRISYSVRYFVLGQVQDWERFGELSLGLGEGRERLVVELGDGWGW